MTVILYSPSTNGFYLPGISTAIPDDVVKIRAAHHQRLLARQAEGATIAPSTGGRPRASATRPAAAATRDQLRAAIRREAARRIALISPLWRQLNDTRSPSEAGARRFARIDAIRDASNAMEALLADVADDNLIGFPVSENPAWPEFD